MTRSFAKYKLQLLEIKQNLINQMDVMTSHFNQINKSVGDESDQSLAHQEEHAFLVAQARTKQRILEIEYALARIENGTFGICEETSEPIEEERLNALPWTRFSIEGAEIQETENYHPLHKRKLNFA